MEDITERENLENAVSMNVENLEATLLIRTKELSNKINELEASNKNMVEREIKMSELKGQIEELGKLIIKRSNGFKK